jgi:GlpG protein
MNKKKFRIYLNAPITLGFVAICVIATALGYLTKDSSTILLFSTYRSSWLSPLTYIRLVCHVFGHAGIEHLVNNMLYILLLGPMLEEKYHDRLITVILTTALVTGIIHNIIQPDVVLLGASGVVFAFILLTSFTGFREGELPVTVILVAVIFIGQQIFEGLFVQNNISNLSHILGGVVGAAVGYVFNRKRR